jgi:N-acetylglucosaminyldiphosphoundecaprenol N-acetyl-beta-D-mannosaminyltransferase
MRVDAVDPVLLNAVSIANVSMDEALSMIERAVRERLRRCVFFVNADCMNLSARDPGYHRILGRDDAWVFGDGAGIKLAGALSRQPLQDNVNGTDMFPLLAAQCAKNGQSIFLLGAKEGVAAEVEARMVAAYPGLRIAGTHHGYFQHGECPEVIARINDSGADIVMVALGAPLQERFIARHRDALASPVLMGVGGLFDFYSGRVPRAPKILRDASLEWTWRLMMEPRRMWRRYLVGNFAFVGRVLWWELAGRNR